MRALLFLTLLGAVGCGDDTAPATAVDMSVKAFDASGQPAQCAAIDVVQPCASTSGSIQCFVCDLSGGGVCAHVCSLLQPDCPTGQTCHEFTVADGGIVSDISVTGTGCDGFGFCR